VTTTGVSEGIGSGVFEGFGVLRGSIAALLSRCISELIEKKELADDEDGEGECRAYECKVIRYLQQVVV
jgi:hypothetical protein